MESSEIWEGRSSKALEVPDGLTMQQKQRPTEENSVHRAKDYATL